MSRRNSCWMCAPQYNPCHPLPILQLSIWMRKRWQKMWRRISELTQLWLEMMRLASALAHSSRNLRYASNFHNYNYYIIFAIHFIIIIQRFQTMPVSSLLKVDGKRCRANDEDDDESEDEDVEPANKRSRR